MMANRKAYEVVIPKGGIDVEYISADSLQDAREAANAAHSRHAMRYEVFIRQYYTDRFGRVLYRVLHRFTLPARRVVECAQSNLMVERYLLDEFSFPEEKLIFEEHLKTCAVCQARVEAGRKLIGGIKQIGKEIYGQRRPKR